jgi:flagellar biosynthetic protein FliQ
MTPEAVAQLVGHALLTAFWIAGPLLAIGLAVGLVLNIVQIATSLQDSAFSTIPRLAAFLAAILLLMPWMLQRMIGYTTALLGDFSRYAK